MRLHGHAHRDRARQGARLGRGLWRRRGDSEIGWLIGLGGAEFRLPLLTGGFRFGALEATSLNKAMSLVVVATALPSRTVAVSLAVVAAHWPAAVNLLAGSLIGAWLAAGRAARLRSSTLHRIIALLLVAMAGVLLVGGDLARRSGRPGADRGRRRRGPRHRRGAAFLGVAGGELLIPTLILLFGVDIKLAGSLALVSLPTMLVSFVRYSRDRSFAVPGHNRG